MTTDHGGELSNFEQTDTFTIFAFDAEGNNELLISPTSSHSAPGGVLTVSCVSGS